MIIYQIQIICYWIISIKINSPMGPGGPGGPGFPGSPFIYFNYKKFISIFVD